MKKILLLTTLSLLLLTLMTGCSSKDMKDVGSEAVDQLQDLGNNLKQVKDLPLVDLRTEMRYTFYIGELEILQKSLTDVSVYNDEYNSTELLLYDDYMKCFFLLEREINNKYNLDNHGEVVIGYPIDYNESGAGALREVIADKGYKRMFFEDDEETLFLTAYLPHDDHSWVRVQTSTNKITDTDYSYFCDEDTFKIDFDSENFDPKDAVIEDNITTKGYIPLGPMDIYINCHYAAMSADNPDVLKYLDLLSDKAKARANMEKFYRDYDAFLTDPFLDTIHARMGDLPLRHEISGSNTMRETLKELQNTIDNAKETVSAYEDRLSEDANGVIEDGDAYIEALDIYAEENPDAVTEQEYDSSINTIYTIQDQVSRTEEATYTYTRKLYDALDGILEELESILDELESLDPTDTEGFETLMDQLYTLLDSLKNLLTEVDQHSAEVSALLAEYDDNSEENNLASAKNLLEQLIKIIQ